MLEDYTFVYQKDGRDQGGRDSIALLIIPLEIPDANNAQNPY